MRLEHSFEVPASPEVAWAVLTNVPRVVPCMPGAELVETVDDSTWKARLKVKLGPVSLVFDADVRRTEMDDANLRTRIEGSGRDARGRGRAEGSVETTLMSTAGGTRVIMTTDLVLSGAVAQYGGGLVKGVSNQLVDSFAECLRAQLAAEDGDADASAAAQAMLEQQQKPVSGVGVGMAAVSGAVRRRLGRNP